MKVFISWSGERSRQLAETLANWIPNVIQAVECFYSSEGIRAGDRWNNEINTQLEVTDFGILCITPANIGAPWLNYEAGALAKRVTARSMVVPVTMGFSPSTLPPPLNQFNGVEADHPGFKKLIESIAEAADSPVDVEEVFGVWWPVLEPRLAELPEPEADVAPPAPPSTDEVLSELLGIVQGIQLDLARTRLELINRGRFADPAELFDFVNVAQAMQSDPALLKGIAGGNVHELRRLLNRVRHGDISDRAFGAGVGVYNAVRNEEKIEKILQAEEDDARLSAAEDDGEYEMHNRGDWNAH